MENPTTYFFKHTECKMYVGLTVDETKLLAWDYNNDNDHRQKMSSIERIIGCGETIWTETEPRSTTTLSE